jgi:hypothetical protein
VTKASGVRSPAETCLSRDALLEDGENFGQKHFIYESAAKLNRPQILTDHRIPNNSQKRKGIYVIKMGMDPSSAVPM